MLSPTHPEARVPQCGIYQPRPSRAVIAGEPTPRAADPRIDATLLTAGVVCLTSPDHPFTPFWTSVDFGGLCVLWCVL